MDDLNIYPQKTMLKGLSLTTLQHMQTIAENVLNPHRHHLSDEAKKRLKWIYILEHEHNTMRTSPMPLPISEFLDSGSQLSKEYLSARIEILGASSLNPAPPIILIREAVFLRQRLTSFFRNAMSLRAGARKRFRGFSREIIP